MTRRIARRARRAGRRREDGEEDKDGEDESDEGDEGEGGEERRGGRTLTYRDLEPGPVPQSVLLISSAEAPHSTEPCRTKEITQPCLLHLHAISLVPHGTEPCRTEEMMQPWLLHLQAISLARQELRMTSFRHPGCSRQAAAPKR